MTAPLTDAVLDLADVAGMLLPLLEPDSGTGWMERALCQQVSPDEFFPEKGGSAREAKRVCRSCLVRAECLQYALDNDERFGVWGGLSERERRRAKRTGQPAQENPAGFRRAS